jgi:hypothetical protein
VCFSKAIGICEKYLEPLPMVVFLTKMKLPGFGGPKEVRVASTLAYF